MEWRIHHASVKGRVFSKNNSSLQNNKLQKASTSPSLCYRSPGEKPCVYHLLFHLYSRDYVRRSEAAFCRLNYSPQGSLEEQLASFIHSTMALFSVRLYTSKKYTSSSLYIIARFLLVKNFLLCATDLQYFNTLIPKIPSPRYTYSSQ